MNDQTQTQNLDVRAHELQLDIDEACHRIPPLWDLPNYVAVNPFIGFAHQTLPTAARIVADGLDAQLLPPLAYYQAAHAKGAWSHHDLEAAAGRAGIDLSEVQNFLDGTRDSAADDSSKTFFTFAERCDLENESDWHGHSLRSTARWCAVYIASDKSVWPVDTAEQSLFANWRTYAAADHSLEMLGLTGWRDWIRSLPDQSDEAMALVLGQLPLSRADRVAYFYRALGGLYGWASYLRRDSWQAPSSEGSKIADFLAVRVCTDAAIAHLTSWTSKPHPTVSDRPVENESLRLVLQDAMEDGYVRDLIGSINPPSTPESRDRPALQAVFCIDVRSEVLRRHLEAQSDQIETRGFAGFFGVSLDWQVNGEHSARCPALLTPGVLATTDTPQFGEPFARMAQQAPSAPAASFSYVELLGLGYGVKLCGDAFEARTRSVEQEMTTPFGAHWVDEESRVNLAAGILKNMGFTNAFARIVLLCGHASCSANNPHAAGLHCGACGGHGGAINARVAASLLNDPNVRKALARRGVDLPEDTLFVPALHDTSVDEVHLLDMNGLQSSHESDITTVRQWLNASGRLTREERAPALGIRQRQPNRLRNLLQRRSRDWSEVRPEWALARNTSFIAARRSRTRGVNLDGRAFLHEYDAANDPDGSILTLILTAPMVVASWINLQYFASTVDNDVLGSGNKVLHNLVGSHGVVLGNGGDLRTGLAVQSVHAADGTWHHQPLRLQVVVESSLPAIDAVLEKNRSVHDLIEHGWVRLFAISPDKAGVCHRRLAGHKWERCDYQDE